MTSTPSFPDRFRNWYEYEKDCNAKTLGMLRSVPDAAQTSPNFQRAIDKMAHLVAARHIWLHRIGRYPEPAASFFPAEYTLDSLPEYLTAIEGAWTEYLASLTDASLLDEFSFTTRDGTRWQWNILDLLTQVFGHAWYHRGQIATLVKDLGGTTADTDYIFWCGTPRKLEGSKS